MAACAAAVVAQAAPQSGRFFARPFVSYIGATNKDYSDAASVGAAIGYLAGPEQTEEVAFEASGFHYTLKGYGGDSIGGETFVPTLLTYRHYFAPAAAAARFYVGAGAGVTEVLTHLDFHGYGYHSDNTDTAYSFTGEASVGVAVRMSDLVTLDVGYRYLHIASHNVTIAADTVSSGAFDANTAYAGVSIRF